jgi:lipoprotein-anchoring transpeptidase ErfK/SrfK
MRRKSAAIRRQSSRATGALMLVGALLVGPLMFSSTVSAQVLGYAPSPQSSPSNAMAFAPAEPVQASRGDGNAAMLPERLRRSVVALNTREAPGTVIIDTGDTALYFVLSARTEPFAMASASVARALRGPARKPSPVRRNGRIGIRRRR